MADRYNGMRRARDWVGKRVEITRELSNGFCKLPAGYRGVIKDQNNQGLTFEGEPCNCCSVQPRMSRVRYHDVRLSP